MKHRHYCPDVYYAESSVEKQKPTKKQKMVFSMLCKECRENGLSENTNKRLITKMDYMRGIAILAKRLKNAGVDVPGIDGGGLR